MQAAALVIAAAEIAGTARSARRTLALAVYSRRVVIGHGGRCGTLESSPCVNADFSRTKVESMTRLKTGGRKQGIPNRRTTELLELIEQRFPNYHPVVANAQ